MERKMWIMGAAGVVVVIGGLGIMLGNVGANSAYADSSPTQRLECGNKLIKGTYGVQMQGTRPVPGGTGIEVMIGVVTRKFDGAGSFTQIDNVKGAISGFAPDRPGSGTYEVSADCLGTTRFEPAPGIVVEERFVVVDYGHEIRSIVTTPQPTMVSTVAKRIGFR